MLLRNSLIVVLLNFALNAMGQIGQDAAIQISTADAIPALEIQEKTDEQYHQSAAKWENVLKTNKKNEDAWINLYKARRYENYPAHSRQISKDGQKKLNLLLEEMKVNVPNTFAFYYASYLNKNKSDESFGDLKSAYALQPENKELWDDMLCKSVIEDDASGIKSFALKLYNSGIYSAAELEYNQNVLSSLEQNGILITYGNADTYPLFILQQIKSFRTDVKIICLEWLGSSRYVHSAEAILKTIPGKVRMNDEALTLSLVLSKSITVPVYAALTLPPDELEKYQSNLYCTGLAMKYSPVPLANLSSLKSNWEQLFKKEQLGTSEPINRNYLVPLLLLAEYYSSSGQLDKKAEVSSLAMKIARQIGAVSTVEPYLR